MIESVEFKSETIARKRIAEDLAGARFARLWDRTPTLSTVAERKAYQHKPEGRLETVVAAFPKALQARGAPQWMRLSRDGIGHIKASGRGITPERLRLVQKAVDGEDSLFQHDKIGVRWVSHIEDDDGQWWSATWKITEDGSRAYLTTLIPVDARRVARNRAKYGR